ncbi:MAG: hypothetical protein K2X81_14560 [Candidatus Obscuribacterales bacterium]|nr:hypothetical protein [Candidatus Obscuribacterales bacterium]
MFSKDKLHGFAKMLLFAVVAPVLLVLAGVLLLSMLEPTPEFGGYAEDWARKIRGAILVLSVGIGFLGARVHLRKNSNQMSSHHKIQALLILLVIPAMTTVLGSFLIYENRLGGGFDAF